MQFASDALPRTEATLVVQAENIATEIVGVCPRVIGRVEAQSLGVCVVPHSITRWSGGLQMWAYALALEL
jgi:hypothetical protein